MNRRSFLKFCGIAPVVPALLTEPLNKNPVVLVNHNTPGIDPNILMPNFVIGEAMEIQIDTVSDIIRAARIIKSRTGYFPPTNIICEVNK